MKDLIKFKITLSAKYWDSSPEYEVKVGDEVIVRDMVTVGNLEPFDIVFERDLDEGEYDLVISLLNKTDADTVQDPDTGDIVKDMLLNIDDVEIDNIPLGNHLWSHGKYRPRNRDEMTGVVNLGWNGDWVFGFKSPYYTWLIENM